MHLDGETSGGGESEHKQARRECCVGSEGLLRMLEKSVSDVISRHDLEVNCRYISPSCRRVLGYAPEELLGKAPFRFLHPDDVPRAMRARDRLVGGGGSEVLTCRFRHKDGRYLWIETSLQPLHDGAGAGAPVCGIELVTRDVTRRHELERAVARVEHRERRRVGQDLHDSLGQELAAVVFLANVLRGRVAKQVPALGDDMARLQSLASAALNRVRQISKGLLPVSMSPGGLQGALEALCKDAQDVYGVPCECRLPHDRPIAGDPEALADLYYIAREAVGNAARHADASLIRVLLCEEDGDGLLAVEDDGSGLPAVPARGAEGLGMSIMHYRADAIGGALHIRTAPGEGTTVTCRFPRRLIECAP
jgi:PAS domain S-box-containing protein